MGGGKGMLFVTCESYLCWRCSMICVCVYPVLLMLQVCPVFVERRSCCLQSVPVAGIVLFLLYLCCCMSVLLLLTVLICIKES